MDKEDLVRKLNSVGKEVFVRHFNLFELYSSGQLSKNEGISYFVSKKVSNSAGAAIRLGNAKVIFKYKMQYEALEIIIQSKKLPNLVIEKAYELINQKA
ncbi:hypothetical protein [Desulfoluna spongiiphila]|uniref:hypothetical protein n=1 Tax=Desulfoluna spongiiphila TaxID=419481 RepID=UPI0012520D4E|nr:hypothetical protein [Desulfoluna spongiiphila]VVS90769.1 hypothetical protein DBB_3370 [Desulfoluna spongiiphila]